MTFKTCKYHEVDLCKCKQSMGACPFASSAMRGSVAWIPYAISLCKYYEPLEEEKYALFVVRIILIPICEHNLGFIDCLGDHKEVKAEFQISSPMPLEELTAKCSSLLDDPVWKEHVKIKKV